MIFKLYGIDDKNEKSKEFLLIDIVRYLVAGIDGDMIKAS